TNKDNAIHLTEFTAYYKDRLARRGGWGNGQWGQDGQAAPPEEEKRRIVYRVGKLPPELKTVAPWFEELDKDKDGQVGLYEWKAAGKSTKEFLTMDKNADGFLTVEEVLRFHKLSAKKDDKKDGAGPGMRGMGMPGAMPGMMPGMMPGGGMMMRGRGRGPG